MTVITSRDRTNFESPRMISPRLPGNTTLKNIDIFDTYAFLGDPNTVLITNIVTT